MGDLANVVEDGRLGIKEEQAKIEKFQGGRERSQEAKKVLTALSFLEEVISNRRQFKLKENQKANSITETDVLKVRETNRIRDLYRGISEIPENRAKLD